MDAATALAPRLGVPAGFVPPPLPLAKKLPEGADALAHAARGLTRRLPQHARRLHRDALQVAAACAAVSGLDEAALTERMRMLREAVRRDPLEAGGQRIAALAAIGEAAYRALGMRPYPVQFMGALALHHGWLAEMATGEGKTLTAALAAVLAAWSGEPCHLVTSNDYLAARDAEEMSPLFERCGVWVAAVVSTDKPDERVARYGADVVYLTAKEMLADFLRDQLAARAGHDPQRLAFRRWLGTVPPDAQAPQIQVRGLHTVIVDEADNVLIDEAVTPLILSAPRSDLGLADAARLVSTIADQLVEERDYELLRRQRTVMLREGARAALTARAAELGVVWRAEPRREELLRQALTVRHFILRGHQYLVDDGKVVLLDEFTGRMTPGRTLTAGLHQAIEAREGVDVTDPNESLGQMSFQTFFRRMPRLAGTTGTGREASAEFWRIYRLGVMPIPTHRPRLTRSSAPRLFESAGRKWQAVVAQIVSLHERGQPVLVGVRSVESSETLAALLGARGLAFELLNAVRHAEEARIIARAGEPGRITIATNMAGRGTDIRLGEGVPAQGGLHVIIAETNESGRIDRQLAGRCGRQGDPGSVSVFVSAEDGLAKRFLSVPSRALVAGAARLHLPFRGLWVRALIRLSQRRAEADAFSRRRGVLKSDDWLDNALPFEPATRN
jgi:preprotein translocase subunit SecA